ncbi:MAG: hypothetical protein ACFFB3_14200 [Candidatus Hodarchaeota archaeon]
MVLPNLKSGMPELSRLEGILSPGLLAESIAKVLEPEEIRQMIQFLTQAINDA